VSRSTASGTRSCPMPMRLSSASLKGNGPSQLRCPWKIEATRCSSLAPSFAGPQRRGETARAGSNSEPLGPPLFLQGLRCDFEGSRIRPSSHLRPTFVPPNANLPATLRYPTAPVSWGRFGPGQVSPMAFFRDGAKGRLRSPTSYDSATPMEFHAVRDVSWN
jgi:hypothetical protein